MPVDLTVLTKSSAQRRCLVSGLKYIIWLYILALQTSFGSHINSFSKVNISVYQGDDSKKIIKEKFDNYTGKKFINVMCHFQSSCNYA